MKVRSLGAWLLVTLALLAAWPSMGRAAVDQEALRQEMVRQINTFRAQEKRGPVTLDGTLNALASEWAAKLAGRGSMEHRSMGNLRSLLSEHGWTAMNENLFMSSAPAAAPSEVMAAWKGSTGHRRNLLQADITRIGLGAARGEKGFFVVFNGAGG